MWSDYLCPWCYAGLARSARLSAEFGIAVTPLPYELHPHIPKGGVPSTSRYSRIATECEATGMPFRPPERVPNSRRALASSEWVRLHAPASHAAVHERLFAAMFVDGLDIEDPDVLDEIVSAAGADATACRAAVDAGELDAALADHRERALDFGVTGTPSWLLDGRILVPGLQPWQTFARFVARL